jgi:lycopene cyclase domain-containing protein
MSYLALDGCFLLIASIVAAVAWRVERVERVGLRELGTVAAALGVVLVLTAVFDNVMIGVGLFSYNPERILGVKLGLVPVEDFGYPVAAFILLAALWALLRPATEGPAGS